ncbi:MAG: MgtC/SapB family protein [Defluviitaleaceae bacterium]|nr:MgtC/SapB family protein [Defluviitaleaceae bacterium]
MENLSQQLSELNTLSIFIRLFLAMLMGGLIGIERGYKGRPAGMRTYMLVCLGSAMVMLTNQFLTLRYGGGDPARLGAQVISGIGFLGAGTIIITRERQVRGLTTAAGLWASACAGLAIGAGFFEGALMGMFFIIFTTLVMHKLDNKLSSRSRSIDVYLEIKSPLNIHNVLNDIRANGTKITHMEIMHSKSEGKHSTALIVSLLLPKRKLRFEVLAEINAMESVGFAEEL